MFINFKGVLGFLCSVNHFSEGGVNQIHNVTCSPSLAEILRMTLDPSRIAREIAIVSEFFCRRKEALQTLASNKNKKDHKNLRSKLLKLVDYCQKQNDHKATNFTT